MERSPARPAEPGRPGEPAAPPPGPRRLRARIREHARLLRAAAALAVVAALAGAALARFVLPGARLVTRLAAPPAPPTDPADPSGWTEVERAIPTRDGALRARLYRPSQPSARTLVLIHGVHREGIDGRAVAGARALASLGHTVLTPEIPSLRGYRLDPRAVDEIEDAARWAFEADGLAPLAPLDRRVGLCGVSFAGGLAVSAAGRPWARERLAFVLSLGGHADLEGLLASLCAGELPGGREPHIYTLALVLRELADRVVPPEQAEPLRRALELFLDDEDPAAARAAAAALPAPSRELAERCLAWESGALARAIEGPLRHATFPAALSPARSAPPRCPVFLLHGAADTVIPPQESERLAALLAPHAEVTLLVSSLVTHVELDVRTSIELLRVALVLTRLRRL